MIKEAYCSFKVAELLKEKGFNIPIDYKNWLCCMYDKNENVHWGVYDKNWYFRITHQMAMKWLREVHNISIEPFVDFGYGNGYWWGADIAYIKKDGLITTLSNYKSYEEAVEAALKYSLENLI